MSILANDSNMSGRSIRFFRHLECQNLALFKIFWTEQHGANILEEWRNGTDWRNQGIERSTDGLEDVIKGVMGGPSPCLLSL